MKSISLNVKINKNIKINEIKNEYRDVADVRIKEIITSINIIVDDRENQWENDAINDNWKKWARKTDTKKRCTSSMFINMILFVKL